MPDTNSSNADALVLATAFPHATEAQRDQIITEMFVRRVAIPRGAEVARSFVLGIASGVKESLHDPDRRVILREGLAVLAREFLPDATADALVEAIDGALGNAPEDPTRDDVSDLVEKYEVTKPKVAERDGRLVACSLVIPNGLVIPSSVRAESVGRLGRVVFCCDVVRNGETRHIEGYFDAPALRAGYLPDGPVALRVEGNEEGTRAVLRAEQFCGAQVERERVAVSVGPENPAGPPPEDGRPCDAEPDSSVHAQS